MAVDRPARHCRCGVRLARDNRQFQCAACQAKARDLLNGAPAVPSDFWSSDGMRSALSSWHMGQVIAAYRNHPWHGRPLRQEIVAGWVGITQAQLSRIENGPALKDLDKLSYWARALDIPAPLLWFQLPDADRLAITPPVATQSHQVRSGNSSNNLQPIPARPRTTEGRTASHLSAVLSFRAADRQVGGGHLYETVTRYLSSELAPQLVAIEDDGSFSFTAAAAVTEMAGWMAHDAGRDSTAERHFNRALDLVKLGDDQQLGVHILASLSHLAHHTGRPTKAVELAQRGKHVLSTLPHQPQLEAQLLAMQAREKAALRQPEPCRQLLCEAEAALTRVPAEPLSAWVSRFDEASLAHETARCLLQIGDYQAAERQAERIVKLRGSDASRSWALGHLLLVTSLLAQRRIDEACALAQVVLEATPQLGSLIIMRQLIELRQQLVAYAGTTVVTEFLSCLTDSLAARQWLQDLAGTDGTP